MGNNDEIFEDGKKGEEELLDFDFDDLSEDDLEFAGGDSSSDEEILELVDIVEPGEVTEDSGSDDLSGLLDDAEAPEKDSSVAEASDLFSDEFAQTVKAEKPGSLEADLDAALEGLGSSAEDIVDTGEPAEAPDVDDITQLLDDDEAFGEDALSEEDLDLDSVELVEETPEEKPSEGLEADLDAALEGMEATEPDTVEAAEAAEEFEPDEIEALLDDEAFEDDTTLDEISEAASDGFSEAVEEEFPDIVEDDLDAALEGLEEPDEGLVKAEDMVDEPESDELSQLLEEEVSLEAPEVTEEELDLGPGELGEALEEEVSESLESDFDSALEELEPSEVGAVEPEIAEAEPESLLDEVALEEATVEPEVPVEPEAPQEVPPELPHEDLSEVVPATEEGLESAEPVVSPAVEGLTGISEERVEAIITNVVQDVVERVTRETMASVAEKVIREAIDALKQSLESLQDQD